MESPRNLQGIDAAWIAVDELGQVALFTTGGEGPIPSSALPSVESAEELACALPETCDFNLLTAVPRPEDYVAFAKRGLFAYDWADVHRASSQASGAYELQARPVRPVALQDLPGPIRALASVTRMPGVSFGSSVVVLGPSVGTYRSCMDSPVND